MKKNMLALALALIFIALPLSSCSTDSGKTVLNVYNWGDYIDEGVLQDFENETGIKVRYSTFDKNEELYTKIKNSPQGSYDVAVPSEYMIKKMMNEGLLEKINMNNVPNYALIDDSFKNLPFDPNNEYSVPYMWGTLAIAYNSTMVDEDVDSWSILWDKKYEKQIFMLNSSRDSLGVALKLLGYSMNTKNLDEIDQAKKKLIEQKPLVLAYVNDELKDKMIAGEGALCYLYSGDGIAIANENPDIKLAIPKEGTNLFFDSMCILKGTKNKEAAEEFINFMCRTDIAARNREEIEYATPQREVFEDLPDEIRENNIIYPDDVSDKVKYEVFDDLAADEVYYNDFWTQVIAE